MVVSSNSDSDAQFIFSSTRLLCSLTVDAAVPLMLAISLLP